jgi:hypothetical protein
MDDLELLHQYKEALAPFTISTRTGDPGQWISELDKSSTTLWVRINTGGKLSTGVVIYYHLPELKEDYTMESKIQKEWWYGLILP